MNTVFDKCGGAQEGASQTILSIDSGVQLMSVRLALLQFLM